jgi:hypothetical protein
LHANSDTNSGVSVDAYVALGIYSESGSALWNNDPQERATTSNTNL